MYYILVFYKCEKKHCYLKSKVDILRITNSRVPVQLKFRLTVIESYNARTAR